MSIEVVRESTPRYKGVVRWFDVRLGYGFIEPKIKNTFEKDIFVHWSQIMTHGNRYDKRKTNLMRGDIVHFNLKATTKGFKNQLQALNVIKEMPCVFDTMNVNPYSVYQLTRFDILKYNSNIMCCLYL